MIAKSKEICPLCSSLDIALYQSFNDFEIMKCNICTNAWTNPAPKEIDYVSRDFHMLEVPCKTEESKKLGDLPIQWQNSINQQLTMIKSHLSAGASILEIGCGEGIFLSELKRLGYSTLGVEPSKSAAKRAQLNGLNVLQGYFPNPEIGDAKFDLVVMSHVFEHIEKPHQMLASIKNVLKKDGKILFVQTHYSGLIPRLLRSKWYAWVYQQHYWHFTPYGICFLAKDFGFHEVCAEYSSLVHYDEKKNSFKDISMKIIERILRTMPNKNHDQFHLMLSL